MSSPVERMKKLINYLPEKDIKLGNKFIDNRDFESLQELVDSARYKVRKSLSSDNPKSEYINLDMDKIDKLKVEVDAYCLLLNPDIDNDDDYDSWEEEL